MKSSVNIRDDLFFAVADAYERWYDLSDMRYRDTWGDERRVSRVKV
ncbi:MAG: hypothetical protein H3Z50_01260 [archaeon]|nr:hypothetical protein [archaeon]MCP8306260.1 hypothetical protein [archaeon]